MSKFIEEGEVLEIGSSKSRNGTMWRIQVEDCDTGDSEWYGLGKDEPDYGEGSIISFEYEETDGGYLNIFGDSLEVIDEKEPKKKGRGSRGSNSGSRGGRGGSRDSESKRGGSRGSSHSGGRSSGRSSRGGDDDDSKSSRRSSGSKRGSGSSNKSGGSGTKGGGYQKDPSVQALIELQAARNSATEFLKVAFEQGALSLPTKKADKLDALYDIHNQEVARFLEQNQEFKDADFDPAVIFEDAGDE